MGKFYVGQKTMTRVNGDGVIEDIGDSRIDPYPITVDFDSGRVGYFTLNGYKNIDDIAPSLYPAGTTFEVKEPEVKVTFTHEQQVKVQELMDEAYKRAYDKAKRARQEPEVKCEACEIQSNFPRYYFREDVNSLLIDATLFLLKTHHTCKEAQDG